MRDSARDHIIRALERAGCDPKQKADGSFRARCPAHDDREPSLDIAEGADGRVLLLCRAGCETVDVLPHLELSMADLFDGTERVDSRDEGEWTPYGPALEVYRYTDETGTLLFEKCRCEGKQFPQRRPDPSARSGWAWKLGDVRQPLYRLPRVLKAIEAGETVFVAEGEKDVHALERAGVTATCNPGGAGKSGKWRPEHTETLRGADVVVVADGDDVGRGHALSVAKALEGVAERVRRAEARAGKDAYDHLAAGFSVEDFELVPDGPTWPGARSEEATSPPPGPPENVALPHRSEMAAGGWPSLDPAALYGLPGEVVRALEPHTEADRAALLGTVLVSYGAAVGPGPHAIADGAPHPALLFLIVVGESAKARKGSSWVNPMRVMRAAEPDFFPARVLGGFGSGEAVVDEVTGEDQRLLVHESEFARVLNVGRRDGATLSPIIRAAWDGGRLQVRSRSGTSVADAAHVCLVGHITVDELRAKLTETEVASGFVNRHLIVCARRSKRLPSGGNLDDQTIADLGAKVHSALSEARKATILRRTPEAEARWAELYDLMAEDEPGGLLGAVIARDAAQVLRLSAAYALTDGSHRIELAHLEAAWALWRYCRASAAYVFGETLGDEVADKLLAAIRAAGSAGLDGSGQRDLFGRHANGKRLENARQLLEDRGFIVNTREPTGGRDRVVSVATEATEATEGERQREGLSSPTSLSSHDSACRGCEQPTPRCDDDGRPWCLSCETHQREEVR
jgi:hypothetical protein